MPNTPLTSARYPASTAAPNVNQDIQNAALDLEDNMIAGPFASTTARDTAFSNWVALGNSMREGLHCWVTGVGGMVYLGGAWQVYTNAPNLDGFTVANMAARPTTGRFNGQRVWDSATSQFYTYDGTYWRNEGTNGLVPPGAAAGNYITCVRGFTSATANSSGVVTVTHGKTFSAAPATVEATSAGGEVSNATQVYPISNTITTTAFNVGFRDFSGTALGAVAVKFNWRVVGYNT